MDIRAKLAGLELENPIVVASGDIGCHVGQIKEAEHFGATALITKGCIPLSGASGLTRKTRIRVDFKKNALRRVAGFRRLGLEQAENLISDAKKEAVDEGQCLGCETCASICPETAITMVRKK